MSLKKPTNIKLLEGNPGKRPINKKEPQPEKELLKCPSWLNNIAKYEWNNLSKQLYNLGLLTKVDKIMLAEFCQSYSRWREAESQLKKDKFLIPTKGGFKMNPLIAISKIYTSQMNYCIAKLGLSPSDRAKLEIDMDILTDEEKEMAKYLSF